VWMKKTKKPTTAQRRAFVMSLRDSGLTYEQIAAEAIKKFGKTNLPKGYDKRLAHLDLQRELSKHSRKTLETKIRRNMILKYRMSGMTFQQIVTKLEAELGKQQLPAKYNERLACRDLKRYLEKIDSNNKQEINTSRSLHRERLNFLLNLMWDKAEQGDYRAIDRTFKISEALAKLDEIEGVTRTGASADGNTIKSFAELSDHFFDITSTEVNHAKS